MMTETQPFISVIIPVYNDNARLELLLAALEAQTYPAFEVIVVDNASDMPPDDIVARFSHARLVYESQRGSYASRNRGLSVAQGQYLAFTDSDCIPYPDWLENGIRHVLQHTGCGLVGGRIEVFAENPPNPNAAELFELMFAFQVESYIRERHYAPTANMFTNRETFDQVGLFDGSLQSNGDNEWGERVYAHGGWQIYAADVIVRHPARQTVAELLKKRRRVVGGQVQRLSKRRSFWQTVTRPQFWRSLFPRDLRVIKPLLSNRWTLRQRIIVSGVLMRIYATGVVEKLRLVVSKK